ncbi:MAG: hypothetical protein KKC78_13665 [Proteobacteria bacterium]|nr:hypothetical protein [Pseudomonadota bacterium]
MSRTLGGRCWVALSLALLAGLALLSPGCSSEPGEGVRQSETTTRAAAPEPLPRPDTAPKAPSPGNDPSQLLEQARQSLAQGKQEQALGLLEGAAQALWRRLPLKLAQATLVIEPAKGYGIYQARDSNVYLVASPERPVFPGKGQPMYIYLEPMGYEAKSLPGGRFGISLAMDVELFDVHGKSLFSRKDFMRTQTTSHHFNREFFLNVTVNLKGAPPGVYKLRLTLKDLVGKQETVATLPVKLAMAPVEKK